jgi:hypothetical protein
LSSPPPGDFYLRAVVSKKIEPANEGAFVIDGDWRIRVVHPTSRPILRTSESNQELLVPVSPGQEKVDQAVVVLEYRW